ncbi:MAG TPA: hypothetical protein VJQ52_01250 [Steroidobacteraceae bacterium]|nr:hypothetical protein [Steroidobacteraceae bacterium]
MLMVAVAGAATEEPSAADAQAQVKKEEAAPSKPADKATADERVVMIDVQDGDKDKGEARPFKPPPGYKPKRLNGEQVYCAKLVVLGSRFPKEDCRTAADLRELELRKAEMRNDVERTRSICTSDNGGCGMD